MGDDEPVPADAEGGGDVGGGEPGVREDDVAGTGGVLVLARVHRASTPGDELRMVQRDEVVDHGRAEAAALRRVHPVGEEKRVDPAEEAFRGRVPEPAPGGAEGVRGRKRPQPHRHLDALERGADLARPVNARRRERDELVPAGPRLGHPGKRAADVVPDPRPGMREGRDVDRDPHRPSSAKPLKCAPRTRSSVFPGITSAGTAVGETVYRTTQTPFASGRTGMRRTT